MRVRTARPISGSSLPGLLLLILAPAMAGAQAEPARVGQWEAPRAWPIVGIHAAMLPTGEVMHLTYVDHETELETAATVWNPATGMFRDVSPGFGDMFCSGQNFLPTGELFVAGGFLGLEADQCFARGTRPAYVFDPFTSEWREIGDMKSARFYPTVLALPKGEQLIIGGQGERCEYIPTMELFNPREDTLKRVRGPNRVMRDYPRAFLLSTGEIAHVMPEPTTSILDRKRKFWSSVEVTRLGRNRYEGVAFYVPGFRDNLMICGGYLERLGLELENPTASCERINFSVSDRSWREVSPMRFARGDINAVLLPDGKVLVVGGGEHHRYEEPNLRPELYDPETDSWTLMAPQRLGRMYHSTAVLLPDGRVLSAGQDDGDEDGHVSGKWGEVYSPPYLFKGPRPVVRKAPSSASYGSTIRLKVKRAQRVERVVLMGLSAVTHATNVGQRYVPLDFKLIGRRAINAVVTDNLNEAPGGYYMLFAVSDKGVPSVARMIHLVR